MTGPPGNAGRMLWSRYADWPLSTGDLPVNGGDRPQLTITVPYDLLSKQLGTGLLDTGQRLTPTQTRRLACDAHLLPAVLGSHGQVLDVGQSRRLITGALRRALVLRDRGCAFPGCDRPPRWCDGHHIQPWTHGGPTSSGQRGPALRTPPPHHPPQRLEHPPRPRPAPGIHPTRPPRPTPTTPTQHLPPAHVTPRRCGNSQPSPAGTQAIGVTGTNPSHGPRHPPSRPTAQGRQ